VNPDPTERFTEVARAELATGSAPAQRLAACRAVVTRAEAGCNALENDTSHVACGPGCGTCCVVNVTILEPEALAIQSYVMEQFSPNARQQLAARLMKLDLATASLDDQERIMVRQACAFLDERQMCSIHPVRPLLCRSVTSVDAGQCRDALAMVAFDESPQIICHLEHWQLFEEAFHGLARALDEHGLDTTRYRLTGLLAQRLNDTSRPD